MWTLATHNRIAYLDLLRRSDAWLMTLDTASLLGGLKTQNCYTQDPLCLCNPPTRSFVLGLDICYHLMPLGDPPHHPEGHHYILPDECLDLNQSPSPVYPKQLDRTVRRTASEDIRSYPGHTTRR